MIALPAGSYDTIRKHLDEIDFNHLFARAVVEGAVSGRVYVNDVSQPRTYYIVHRYGMSLLGGEVTHTEFNLAFREYALNTNRSRTEHEWMQVFPSGWNTVLPELLRNKLITAKDNTAHITQGVVELNTRVNFRFKKDTYLNIRADLIRDDPDIVIADTTSEIYDQMRGSVVPQAFWNSPGDFISKGVSYSVYYKGKLAATCFSSFVAQGKLELGIETSPEFRGMGLAGKACVALIDYCIDRQLEPIWACRLENMNSLNSPKN